MKGMGELLKQAARENRTEDLAKQLRKVGSAFLTHREVSTQEAAYRLLSLPMRQLSRSVVFINTNKKEERIAVLKPKIALDKLDDEDEDVFQKSIIDWYQQRPVELESMCLAKFAATYVVVYPDEDVNDALPPHESSIINSRRIKLKNGFGYMNKRKTLAVIRFRRYNEQLEPSNFFGAKLMLYFPWRNEDTDLFSGYPSYRVYYESVSSAILANETKFNQVVHDPLELLEDGPPEHMWPSIAPSAEESRLEALREGVEALTEISQDDTEDNPDHEVSVPSADITVRFITAASVVEIPAREY